MNFENMNESNGFKTQKNKLENCFLFFFLLFSLKWSLSHLRFEDQVHAHRQRHRQTVVTEVFVRIEQFLFESSTLFSKKFYRTLCLVLQHLAELHPAK